MDTEYASIYPELYHHHWWWRTRERILLRKLRVLLRSPPDTTRILDVGCGAGLFFDALTRFGRVQGIESDPAAVQQSGRWRDSIYVGELNQDFDHTGAYDAILMLDFLEHVEEPEEALRNARRVLAPGGFLLITVPAFGWLWTAHDDRNHHQRRYTAPGLRDTLHRAGFSMAERTYLFQTLVLAKLIVRGLERGGLKSGAPQVPARGINRALQAWCQAEHSLLRRIPVGSSIMAVARPAAATG